MKWKSVKVDSEFALAVPYPRVAGRAWPLEVNVFEINALGRRHLVIWRRDVNNTDSASWHCGGSQFHDWSQEEGQQPVWKIICLLDTINKQ